MWPEARGDELRARAVGNGQSGMGMPHRIEAADGSHAAGEGARAVLHAFPAGAIMASVRSESGVHASHADIVAELFADEPFAKEPSADVCAADPFAAAAADAALPDIASSPEDDALPIAFDGRPEAPAAPLASGPTARAEELREIAELYLSGTLTEAMRNAAEDLLVAGLDDPAASVRLVLAEAFASEARAPRALVLGLAQDIPRIAAVVVAATPCLLDVELLEIARMADPVVLRALASRRNASARLVARLVDRADAALAQRLAENLDLPLEGAALERLVTGFGPEPAVRDALLARPGLPACARLTLVDQASARLVDGLQALNWATPKRLEAAALDARNRAALEVSDRAITAAGGIVARLQASSRLTPNLILRAACEGHVAFLVAALSRLSGASEGRVVSTLSAGRAGPLDALCRRSGLPHGFSDALRAAARVMAEVTSEGGAEDLSRRPYLVCERVLARYESGARRQPSVHAALRGLAVEASRDEARRRRAA